MFSLPTQLYVQTGNKKYCLCIYTQMQFEMKTDQHVLCSNQWSDKLLRCVLHTFIIRCVIKREPSDFAHLSSNTHVCAHPDVCTHNNAQCAVNRLLGNGRSTWLPAVVIFHFIQQAVSADKMVVTIKTPGCYCCWMAPLFLHSSVVWTLLWFPWLIITKPTWAFLCMLTQTPAGLVTSVCVSTCLCRSWQQ